MCKVGLGITWHGDVNRGVSYCERVPVRRGIRGRPWTCWVGWNVDGAERGAIPSHAAEDCGGVGSWGGGVRHHDQGATAARFVTSSSHRISPLQRTISMLISPTQSRRGTSFLSTRRVLICPPHSHTRKRLCLTLILNVCKSIA